MYHFQEVLLQIPVHEAVSALQRKDFYVGIAPSVLRGFVNAEMVLTK